MSAAFNLRYKSIRSPWALHGLAEMLAAAAHRGWRREVERVRSGWGARCVTSHVTEGEWFAQWRAGMDPAAAVMAQLDVIE